MEINALEAWGKDELRFSTSELNQQVTYTRNNGRKEDEDKERKRQKVRKGRKED